MCNCFEPVDLQLTEPIHSQAPAPLTYLHTNQIAGRERDSVSTQGLSFWDINNRLLYSNGLRLRSGYSSTCRFSNVIRADHPSTLHFSNICCSIKLSLNLSIIKTVFNKTQHAFVSIPWAHPSPSVSNSRLDASNHNNWRYGLLHSSNWSKNKRIHFDNFMHKKSMQKYVGLKRAVMSLYFYDGLHHSCRSSVISSY